VLPYGGQCSIGLGVHGGLVGTGAGDADGAYTGVVGWTCGIEDCGCRGTLATWSAITVGVAIGGGGAASGVVGGATWTVTDGVAELDVPAGTATDAPPPCKLRISPADATTARAPAARSRPVRRYRGGTGADLAGLWCHAESIGSAMSSGSSADHARANTATGRDTV
jgi:hypothetical protein